MSASLVNVRVVLILQHRNVRVVRFFQHWSVRVLFWSMCEWCGYNVRVSMECASASTVKCELLVMCESKCASDDVLVAHLCQ